MLYLLDSSAVLNDFNFNFQREHSYIMAPLAVAELRDLRSKSLADNALQQGLLRIEEPGAASLARIKESVAAEGFSRLSTADISVLALALDLRAAKKRFSLISDDYSVQNFCKLLGIPFAGVIRGKIKDVISFSLRCPACGKTAKKGCREKNCPDCGAGLKTVKSGQKAP
ncbi:MAG: hypothetical protein NTW59_00965 [Candidatus Diapherotrites archaeon]|nr:hypothetical protein [Candidatus Diapherotrites archaeon]